MKQIEVLYFLSCPTWQLAVERVRQTLVDGGLAQTASMRLVEVTTEEEAQRLRFLGSPSVRIDGEDVDLAARARTDFGLQCRLYEHEGRLAGLPPAAWIRQALDLAPAATLDAVETAPCACGGKPCL